MIELRFSSADLLQVRFAISPAEEVLGAARTVAEPALHSYHLPWLRRLPGGDPLDGLGELVALVTSCEPPDFLSPPPSSPVAELAEQMDRLRRTSPAVIAAELGRALDRVPDALADPAHARTVLADQLETAWQRLLEATWPQLRALLQGDILARGQRLADRGARAVFDGLHPQVRWADRSLRIASDFDDRADLSGDGLLLVPSVFTWPDVQIMMDPPWQKTLIYPAPGIGALWEPPRTDPVLARAFGRTRGTLLSELTQPASTTMLADRHGAAPSTISAHLTALRDAGLLTTTRHGRSTYYRLSALGYALLLGHGGADEARR